MATMITLVVDRSGSMENIYTATQEGLSKFLKEQGQLPGSETMKVSLYTFDDMVETPFQNVPLKDCVINPMLIEPRGSTALFDALGVMFSNSSADPQIVVIMTDGAENSSRTYSKLEIMGKISERRKWGWTFIFLAANQDAIASGANLGIPKENACTFGANTANVGGVFKAVSDSVKRIRTGEDAGFTQLERQTSSTEPSSSIYENVPKYIPQLTRQTCDSNIWENPGFVEAWEEPGLTGPTYGGSLLNTEPNLNDIVCEIWTCTRCTYKNKCCLVCQVCESPYPYESDFV